MVSETKSRLAGKIFIQTLFFFFLATQICFAQWYQQNSGTTQNLNDVTFIDANNGTAVGGVGTIIKTTNGGTDWTSQSSGTINYLYGVSFTDSNNGTAVGDYGKILRTTNGGVTFIEDENNFTQPKDFLLKQNYPNPFNPSTSIRYSVPRSTIVVIKVYDILGNEIETLVNEEKPIGIYEITWNAENLPSGVYFYRLQTDNFVEIKKMVLLR